MSNSPSAGIPYVPENTQDPAAGLNLAINVIDALIQCTVISKSLSAPPPTPADGDTYIVGPSPTGAWSGHANDIARYVSEGNFWQFYIAGEQARIALCESDGLLYTWHSSGWHPSASSGDGSKSGFLRSDGVYTNELESNGGQQLIMRAASDTLVPNYTGLRARGTLSSPAPIASTDTMTLFVAGGWNGIEYKVSTRVRMRAEEAYTNTASGSGLQFEATPIGANAAVVRMRIDGLGNILPGADNVQNAGSAGARLKEIFAGNSVINTSDARQKTPVRPLSADELAVAAKLGGEIGAYQWRAMLDEKGPAARSHIGMTVQRAIEILRLHGLDPFVYGFICYDEWDELPEIRDEEGEIVQERRQAGDRYSFRMDELLAFIVRGLAHRLDSVEHRLVTAGL